MDCQTNKVPHCGGAKLHNVWSVLSASITSSYSAKAKRPELKSKTVLGTGPLFHGPGRFRDSPSSLTFDIFHAIKAIKCDM